MEPKSERFEMRLDPTTIERIDQWRSEQDDLPSRAEAVRRLVAIGVTSDAKPRTTFSDGERLLTLMLCDIYKRLEVESEIKPDFIAEALYGGHHWALRWEYPGIFHERQDSDDILSEVVNILDMWSFIEGGYTKLSKADKTRVKKEANPFGDHVTFIGFDGNNESQHLSIARFLIEKLHRFSNLADRGDLNSHFPSIDMYRRMYRVFEPMRRGLMGRSLSAGEIIDILKAMVHPSRKGAE
jgi:uncharacterized protein YfbU (UPF0304 family)